MRLTRQRRNVDIGPTFVAGRERPSDVTLVLDRRLSVSLENVRVV